MPVGYKQTDVGVIPEDWEVKSIGQVCKLINGRGFKPFEWKKEGLPIIRIQNLNGSDDFNYFQGTYDKKIEVENNQLLFAWSGSRGTSFGSHIWRGSLGLLNYHTWKMVVKENEVSQSFFLNALKQLTKFIEDKAHGASALVHTQKWEMEGFLFPLPPTLTEQTAIATALSDVDALLNQLDKLIAKKGDIKHATMQQLLTGKKRLAGFSGEWEVKKLGDVCWYQEGPGLRQWQFTKRGMKVINVTNLENGILNLDRTDRHISIIEFTKMYQHFAVDADDIVMASSGNSYGKVAIVRKQDLPLVMNTSVIRFKPLKNLSYQFLWIFLNSDFFKEQIDLMITGGAQPNFGPFHLNKIELCIPSIEEQTAIATLLTDMDTEITQLQQRRHKTHALKQGMMQQLLTGKIRLI